jgi:hypothetical protein
MGKCRFDDLILIVSEQQRMIVCRYGNRAPPGENSDLLKISFFVFSNRVTIMIDEEEESIVPENSVSH